MWWACPSYSGCDSEIEFPLDVGCKRQGVKLNFELKGLNACAVASRRMYYFLLTMNENIIVITSWSADAALLSAGFWPAELVLSPGLVS